MINVLFIVLFAWIVFSSETSFAQAIPEGFIEYKIKKGDVLEKIAPREHWNLIQKVNRIDERHLIIGKKILLPVDLKRASDFLPIPKFIEQKRLNQRCLYVFLDTQYFGAYEDGKLVFWGPISSGKKDTSTPAGKFSVMWKSKFYRSRKFDADMPFAVNISHVGYFLHEQSLPGRPASHGCIRLLHEDAKKIYAWIKKNDPVIISSNTISKDDDLI